jgi:hypothetical protein
MSVAHVPGVPFSSLLTTNADDTQPCLVKKMLSTLICGSVPSKSIAPFPQHVDRTAQDKHEAMNQQ